MRGSKWILISVIAGALAGGCASLNERTSLDRSVGPPSTRGYLYGRFTLNPGSATQPRLFLQLSDIGTGEFLTVHLRDTTEAMHLIDVAPGRYQFTQLLFVPLGAMDMDVRRDPLRLPPPLSFLGRPFEVEAGKAYYVGDWVGALSRDVDFYFVFSTVKLRWGIYRLTFDYERSTREMKLLYPALGSVETSPAWRD